MSKQSLKTIIQEANQRQEARKIAAEKGMTLIELARSNGWKGEVQEFIGVLVSYGSLFDERFSEQLPSLEAHLAERSAESLMVMTEVVGTHLEAISHEIEAGMYQPPKPAEEHADFGELLAGTVGDEDESAAIEVAAEPTAGTLAEPLADAAERADALLDQFTAGSSGVEEAEGLLAELMAEVSSDEEAPEETEVPVAESDDLLAELMGDEAPVELESAADEEEAPEGASEPPPVADEAPAEEAVEALLAAEEPALDSDAFVAELEALAETVEPEIVAAAEENNEDFTAEAEEDEMSDLLAEDETLPEYLSSYLEAAEPSATADGEDAAGEGVEDLLADVAAAEAESAPEVAEPSLADILESGEEALAELAVEAAAAEETESAAASEETPVLVDEADAVDDMMAAMGNLMEASEEAPETDIEAPVSEAPLSEEEPAMAPEEEPMVEEEAPVAEEMPEMESLPPIDEVPSEVPSIPVEAAPTAAPAAGETVRVVAESFVVVRDGMELYRGGDKGDAAMVLREAFVEHGQEGLLLKRVVEREIVRSETEEVLMPFSFSVDVRID